MKKCVFAGSFDPFTNGHLNVVEKCAMMFDEVVVAIGVNPDKKCMFSVEDRLKMLEKATARFHNVTVKYFDGFVADFMREENAVYYVRGIRDQKDIDYEEKSFKVTSKLNPDVQMMFFNAPKALMNVSSTRVKQLLIEGKSISKLVPEEVASYLQSKK